MKEQKSSVYLSLEQYDYLKQVERLYKEEKISILKDHGYSGVEFLEVLGTADQFIVEQSEEILSLKEDIKNLNRKNEGLTRLYNDLAQDYNSKRGEIVSKNPWYKFWKR